jgi:hypothetical protein
VRDRLLNAPTWVTSLLSGGLFGLLNTVTGRLIGGENWTEASVGGAMGGFVFGAVMGPVLARQQLRARDAVGTRSAAELRRAARAANRGPVPDDRELREAARRYALHQRGEILRQRRWGIPFLVVVAALIVWLALRADAVFWWFAVGLLLVAFVAYVAQPRRLERRAELLADPPA